MGAAPVVIVLVGLIIPITLLLFAIAFDVALILWATWHRWRVRHDAAPVGRAIFAPIPLASASAAPAVRPLASSPAGKR